MENSFLTSLILFLPVAGALFLLLVPGDKKQVIKYIGFGFTIITFILSIYLYYQFDVSKGGFQFVDKASWISNLDISYFVGVDGLALILVLLTTFITPIALVSSWSSINEKVKEFTFFVLVLEAGMIGVFVSLDLFLFYVFWEAMLIPMYFIIGIWGGKRRIYASVKFFIYTMAGSLLMLVAIIWLGVYAGSTPTGFTTDITKLYQIAPDMAMNIQLWMFAAFAISFSIKVPLFPFHTWLPDAHVEAPTAGSVILAGVLLKMGTYGLIRFNLPLFPDATLYFAPWFATLSVIGIIYGALVAMVQTDMKKLVAYSSVAHMGFIVLGIFAGTVEAMQGAIIQMVNHGLSTGALFLMVGYIYERTHTREIADYGGIAKVVPVYATLLLIVSLSSIGVPGLNGFIGEFLILLGSFKSPIYNNWIFSIIAASGVIFAAVYLLWMYQRVCLEKIKHANLESLKDLDKREFALLMPLILFIVWIGIYPSTFLRITEVFSKDTVNTFLQNIVK